MGRRNRSQRLMEYNERRASILGLESQRGCFMTSQLAGRKRQRAWDWPPQYPRRLENAVALDVIPETVEHPDVEEDCFRGAEADMEAEEEDKMHTCTVVFGSGPAWGVRAG